EVSTVFPTTNISGPLSGCHGVLYFNIRAQHHTAVASVLRIIKISGYGGASWLRSTCWLRCAFL
ncbi:MAG: hypothetical protein ACOVOG_04945, partial [Rubrivivax sp.]